MRIKGLGKGKAWALEGCLGGGYLH
jgi:hypothetical protein